MTPSEKTARTAAPLRASRWSPRPLDPAHRLDENRLAVWAHAAAALVVAADETVLPEPFAGRESAPSTRLPLHELLVGVDVRASAAA